MEIDQHERTLRKIRDKYGLGKQVQNDYQTPLRGHHHSQSTHQSPAPFQLEPTLSNYSSRQASVERSKWASAKTARNDGDRVSEREHELLVRMQINEKLLTKSKNLRDAETSREQSGKVGFRAEVSVETRK